MQYSRFFSPKPANCHNMLNNQICILINRWIQNLLFFFLAVPFLQYVFQGVVVQKVIMYFNFSFLPFGYF